MPLTTPVRRITHEAAPTCPTCPSTRLPLVLWVPAPSTAALFLQLVLSILAALALNSPAPRLAPRTPGRAPRAAITSSNVSRKSHTSPVLVPSIRFPIAEWLPRPRLPVALSRVRLAHERRCSRTFLPLPVCPPSPLSTSQGQGQGQGHTGARSDVGLAATR